MMSNQPLAKSNSTLISWEPSHISSRINSSSHVVSPLGLTSALHIGKSFGKFSRNFPPYSFMTTPSVLKHQKCLQCLRWNCSLNKVTLSTFTCPISDPNLPSPRTSLGALAQTPHFVYIDDGVYINFFDVLQIKQAVAASIEAIFILLGPSELDHQQDPISFDKLKEMVIGPVNRILGNSLARAF